MTTPRDASPQAKERAQEVWFSAEAACITRHPSVPRKTACTICWTDEVAKALDTHTATLTARLASAEEYGVGQHDRARDWENRYATLQKDCARLKAAVEQARAEWTRILNEWEAAYPEDVFRPFTAADHPHVSPDRIAAEMGRHMARTLRKQIAAALTPAPPGGTETP